MSLRERAYAAFTDDRFDPHLFLAGLLALTALVGVVLFRVFPA